MDVAVIGAGGKVGSIVPEYLEGSNEYDFAYLDADPAADDVVEVDARDYADLRDAVAGADAIVNLAVVPGNGDGENWPMHFDNLRIAANAYRAAWETGVETVVYASTNHVVGMYEQEAAPELYDSGTDLHLDHAVPPRPDSLYAAGKLYGEGLGRYAIERDGAPHSVSALRIGTVREPPYDNPYGVAEQGVASGAWERGDPEYERWVKRARATWQSRRDLAHMFECCLRRPPDGFEVFYGVSDNSRRWFDISHARDVIGYDPQDDGEEWTEPPAELADR